MNVLIILLVITPAAHKAKKAKPTTSAPVAVQAAPAPAANDGRAAAALSEALSMMGPRSSASESAAAATSQAPAASSRAPSSSSRAPAQATSSTSTNGLAKRLSGPTEAVPVQVIDLFVAGGIISRSQTYNDDLFGRMQPYSLPVAPSLAGMLEYYPGGHVAQGLPAAFGLVFSGKGALGVRTRNGEAVTQTQLFAFEGGVRARLVRGRVDAGLSFMGGVHHFAFGAPAAAGATDSGYVAASVSYVGLAPGASLRLSLPARFTLMGSFQYAILVSAGELKTKYFPRTSGGAIDASLAISYALTPWLDMRLMGNLRWYALDFHPQVGDPYVAGGSDDRYFTMMLGFAVRI